MAQHCFRCFGNHFEKDCPDKPVKLHEVYRPCLFPNRIGETIFHRSGFTRNCQHKKYYSFLLFWQPSTLASYRRQGRVQFATDGNGILNLWQEFINFCKGSASTIISFIAGMVSTWVQNHWSGYSPTGLVSVWSCR